MSNNLNKIHAKNEEKTSTQTSIPTAIHSFFFLQNRTEKKEGASVHLVLCKF